MSNAVKGLSGTATTITVSAPAKTSKPFWVVIMKPPTARIGSRSTEQTRRSYQGISSSGLGSPKTSTTAPSSKGAMPSKASTETVWRLPGDARSMARS